MAVIESSSVTDGVEAHFHLMESFELFPDSERTLLKCQHIYSLARVAFFEKAPPVGWV